MKEINYEVVKHNLKSARMRVGMTQEEAAKIFGVSRQTVNNWENSPANLSVEQLNKMASAYNCTVGFFFGL